MALIHCLPDNKSFAIGEGQTLLEASLKAGIHGLCRKALPYDVIHVLNRYFHRMGTGLKRAWEWACQGSLKMRPLRIKQRRLRHEHQGNGEGF